MSNYCVLGRIVGKNPLWVILRIEPIMKRPSKCKSRGIIACNTSQYSCCCPRLGWFSYDYLCGYLFFFRVECVTGPRRFFEGKSGRRRNVCDPIYKPAPPTRQGSSFAPSPHTVSPRNRTTACRRALSSYNKRNKRYSSFAHNYKTICLAYPFPRNNFDQASSSVNDHTQQQQRNRYSDREK